MECSGPLEFRAKGNTIVGDAMRFGSPAIDRPELFLPGSIHLTEPVQLNLQHDNSRQLATTQDGSLRLTNDPSALSLTADLTGHVAELELVRRGTLSGLSVEFRSRREHHAHGMRIIDSADVGAIGLVDIGSYETELEVRRLKGVWLRSMIPLNHVCSCECAGRDCHSVEFLEGSLDSLLNDTRDVLAIRDTYSSVLGSSRSGTLTARLTANGDIELGLTNGQTQAAARVRDTALVAPVHARPVIDVEASQSEVVDGVRRYSDAAVTAILVKTAPTDAREGWEPAEVDGTISGEKRRRRLWL